MAEGLEIALKKGEGKRTRLLWTLAFTGAGLLALVLLVSMLSFGRENGGSAGALESDFGEAIAPTAGIEAESMFLVDLDYLEAMEKLPIFTGTASRIRVAALNDREGRVGEGLHGDYLALLASVEKYVEEQKASLDEAVVQLDGAEFAGLVEVARDLPPRFSALILEGLDLSLITQTAVLLDDLSSAVARADAIKVLELVNESSDLGARVSSLVAGTFPNRQRDAEDQAFMQLVGEAFSAINSESFQEATQLLGAIKEARPGDEKAALVEDALKAEIRRLAMAERMEAIDAAISERAFTRAAKLIEEARTIFPEMNLSSEKHKSAVHLANINEKIQALANRPERLADERVLKNARAALEEARRFATAEFDALRQSTEALEAEVERYSEIFSIELRSNGEAEIEVRGVGFLEPFKQRRLDLKRGRYVLIARCRGFEDEWVNLTVPLAAEQTIRMGCGRRL